jgi:hypothetical protein
VSQIVTKQSLQALASLAFVGILCDDSGDRTKPEYNLGDGADATLYNVLGHDDRSPLDFEVDEHRAFANAFSEGMEFGLAVAASVITHGLDSETTRDAVKAELFQNRYWPDKPASSKEAA